MTELASKRFRPSAKAVVVRDGKILVTRNRTPGESAPDWFILPGGGQHPGETLEETLIREVREETGVEVTAGRLLWTRELILAQRPSQIFDPEEHVIEFMFEADWVADHGDATEEDKYQVSVEWLPFDQIGSIRFYPKALVSSLQSFLSGGQSGPVYLGDVD